MKAILLTDNKLLHTYTHKMLLSLEEIPDFHVVACILNPPPPLSFRAKLYQHWKRGRRGYLLILMFQNLYRKFLSYFSSGEKGSFSLEAWLHERNIPLIQNSDLYSADMLQKIREMHAETAILASYHQIVKKQFIELFPMGVLSYHYGDLRKYRGQPAGFWELYHGEREFRVCVQKITPGIDNGIPIAEQIFEIGTFTTLQDLDRLVEQNCHSLMSIAVQRLMTPGYTFEKPEKYGPLYTLPHLRQWFWFQLKMAVRKIRRNLAGLTSR
ncbi:MAG: methionyl-tRNA formyltransferase [Bacteroidales bacterium]|jgi:folate-dependent phosphoribosylglycinamide formyltransferase PurN|nr:methionyl-tRNA formyltransferase [Bacteroidales bacterium]MDN5329069.1 methionyl-tRNA formyltransferase [Bacteroidales bacterium]